ncbi:MAG: hypothetical protein M1351_07855 [Candidatus Thermoplasmatota archaeon]|jgi:hypothetical protein|nr:hypothetical protein [Candidatus Sysuiplasma jiujiangense]MBX8638969.1 hypothetical protein [Candidatus Sysuiplasma jiujiangense]MBX8640971.1 hypothetical protein [Candidatus Sysuiplasma jiujiangense]MCL5253981.1 hypothetical protein [Candidatus Thermoplasmatota archaeon]
MQLKYKARHFYPEVRITTEMLRKNRRLRTFVRIRTATFVLNPVIAIAITLFIMARVF